METRTINVYRLVPPPVILGARKALEDAFGIRAAERDRRRLYISPVSGCLALQDRRLWQNAGQGDLPATAQEAEARALEFLATARDRVGRHPGLVRAGLGNLFPRREGERATLRTASVRAAFAPGSRTADHWLCWFTVWLETGMLTPAGAPEPPVPVDGVALEVRVGSRGQVVGYRSTWRPFSAIEQVAVFKPSEEEALLHYAVAGEHEPQRFLAPQYLSVAGHDPVLAPACPLSLLVAITGQRLGPRNMQLQAILLDPQGDMAAAGVPGRLSYTWKSWRIDLGFGAGIGDHGRSRTVVLNRGAYNVFLVAEDRKTGAIARTQSIVHVGLAEGGEATS